MPAKHIRQPFFLKHQESFLQTVKQGGRGRVREKIHRDSAQHLLPIPIRTGNLALLPAARAFSEMALKPRPGGSISPFASRRRLRPLSIHRDDNRWKLTRKWYPPSAAPDGGLIHGAADPGNPAGDAGGGLVVDYHHRLEAVAVDRHRAAQPLHLAKHPCANSPAHTRLDAESLRHLRQRLEKCPVSNINTRSPGESVLTIAASQAPVPEPGYRYDGTAGLKDGTQLLQNLRAKSREFCAAMVHDRLVHGPQDTVRHIRWPRNLKKMSTRMDHGEPPAEMACFLRSISPDSFQVPVSGILKHL